VFPAQHHTLPRYCPFTTWYQRREFFGTKGMQLHAKGQFRLHLHFKQNQPSFKL